MRPLVLILILLTFHTVVGQPDSVYTLDYIEKSTSFAWLTYGGDINILTGGTTQQLVDGILTDSDFGPTVTPRITIGGIHFWGHADFYVTFPLSFISIQSIPSGLSDLEVYQGVETGARFYPVKLQPKKLTPFVGMSFRRIRFSQEAEESNSNNGVPTFGRFVHPIQFGLTGTTIQFHITASVYYTFQNSFKYYITPQQRANIEQYPVSFNISLLRYIDSDRGMRRQPAVDQLNKDYRVLKDKAMLSAWFIGLGPSSALQTSQSSYLKEYFPFFYDDYAASILPDVSIGRYFSQVDANVNLSYRTYGNSYHGFESSITKRRHSIGIESVKFIFNYLGFVPFIGPIVSYEHLQTRINGVDYQQNQTAFGFTFGWDIRVTKTGSNLLRTNLRYFPGLHMEIDSEKVMFDDLEFNFIQWVWFPGRRKILANN